MYNWFQIFIFLQARITFLIMKNCRKFHGLNYQVAIYFDKVNTSIGNQKEI